jgi:hypothetical protein
VPMSRRGIACLLAGLTIVSLGKISGSESRSKSDSESCGPRASLRTSQVRAWAASGSIDAMAIQCNTLYVGGSFEQIGPRSGPLVVLSSATGRRDKHFPELTGGVLPSGTRLSDPRVRALVADGRGGFFAGGAVPASAEQKCSGLVHVLASGKISQKWCPQPNGPVEALAQVGRVLYVGGSFSEIGGRKRSALAAVDAASGTVRPWDPHLRFVVSCDHDTCEHLTEVAALAVAGQTVYAGGLFEGAGDQHRPDAVALDRLTARPTAWAPAPSGPVRALLAAGRVVYIGGSFSRAGGRRRSNLAAVDATRGSATGWRADVDGEVEALASRPHFELYVGGNFSRVNGLSANGFAAIDVTTGRTKGWSRGITNSGVSALLRAGRTLYLGGSLTRLSGLTRLRIGALNLDTHRASQWNPAANGDVAALAWIRGKVVAGGWFTAVESVQRSGLAAIELPTGHITAWNPHLAGLVRALLARGDTLYVGGDLTSVNRQSRSGLASFDIPSGELTQWSPRIGEGIYGVEAMALGTDSLFLGGDFESLGGRRHVAVGAVDPASGAVRSWDPQLGKGQFGWDTEITALSLVGRRVYLAGDFAGVGGEARVGVAAVDTETGEALPWNVILDGPTGAGVRTVASTPKRIYVGGTFTRANGVARGGLAILDETGQLAAGGVGVSGETNLTEIMAIAVGAKQVYLAGDFRAIDGHPRPGLGAIEADGSGASEWIPPLADWAYWAPHVLLLEDGILLANGYVSGNGEQVVAFRVSGGSFEGTSGKTSR